MSNETQNRYRQMFIASQQGVEQSKVEKGTIESSEKDQNPPIQKINNSLSNDLQNSKYSQNRYRQMFIASQQGVVQSKVEKGTIKPIGPKRSTQLSKVTPPQVVSVSKKEQKPTQIITLRSEKDEVNKTSSSQQKTKVEKQESIKAKFQKMTKQEKRNFEDKKVQTTKKKTQEFNGIIDFIDKLTFKKFVKIMIIPCILAYFIGTFIGHNLGNLGQLFSKNKKIKEEIESQIKRNNEVVAEIELEEEIIEEAKVETKNNYAYAYKFGNDVLEEKYGVTISYDNSLDEAPKTLKRTI